VSDEGAAPPPAGPWDGALEALDAWGANTAGEDQAAAGGALARPRAVGDGGVVELREVTGETVRAVCRLAVAPSQRHLVAPNAVSLAEAIFSPHAWFRAIHADGVPVGFAMLSLDSAGADNGGIPEYFLWRLMIDGDYQGRGYGREAIRLIIDHVRTLPGETGLLVSWVPGDASPEPFYLGLGFVPTGEVDDGEVVARLAL
jgi:diamine N-acetyltransferase